MAAFEDSKFIVIPTKYLDRLTVTARVQLRTVLNRVQRLRAKDGKESENKYYVVNRNEPYADDVLNTILLGEERKERENGKQ